MEHDHGQELVKCVRKNHIIIIKMASKGVVMRDIDLVMDYFIKYFMSYLL